ncbi:MAG: ketosteroid isomerase-related protein [Verrucomicrobiales bacterium]|nr:ketosteroid isomerase-related protein [Verrucomicrobiales bacterium]
MSKAPPCATLGAMNCTASDTKELIRLYYEAFNAGDRPGMLRLLAPGVVHDINQGASVPGIEAFEKFLAHMDRCYAEQVEDLVVMADESGTRAAAEFYIRGEYLVTDEGLPEAVGQKYHLRVGAFFDLTEGRIARVTNYYNLQDWIAQVGG